MTNQDWIVCLLEQIAYNTSVTQFEKPEFLESLRLSYAYTRSALQSENDSKRQEDPLGVRRRGRPRGKKSVNGRHAHAGRVQNGQDEKETPQS